jgi:hypothetical protein
MRGERLALGVRSGHFFDLADDLFRRIRLADKYASLRQFGIAEFQVRGRDNELDGRPPIANAMGEPYAVHRTRHIDIGEHQTDIALPFKNADRFVGVGRGIGFESGRLDCFKGNHSNERFILDDKDAHELMLLAHPELTPQAG